MTLETLIAIIVLCLAIVVVVVNVGLVVRYSIKLYLEELQHRREAEEARDKRRAMEVAGIISDMRDGQGEALRVAGDVIRGVVEATNGSSRSEADELVRRAMERMEEQGVENQLDDGFHFDDFAGSVPYERETVGSLRPGEGIPGIGVPNSELNLAGEDFNG